MPNTDMNPANGLQGSSPIYNYGTSANTRVATSQKVRLLAPAYGQRDRQLTQMGVVSSFSMDSNKTVDEVRGIGFGDVIAELVPSITQASSGTMERALMYLSNIFQSVGYAGGVDGPVRSLAHHRWPFDLEQQVVFSTLADRDLGAANVGRTGTGFARGQQRIRYPSPTTPTGQPQTNLGHSALITLFEACWMTSHSLPLSKDSGALMESAGIMATDVHDFATLYGEFLQTGNDPSLGQAGTIRYNPNGNVSGTDAGFAGTTGT